MENTVEQNTKFMIKRPVYYSMLKNVTSSNKMEARKPGKKNNTP